MANDGKGGAILDDEAKRFAREDDEKRITELTQLDLISYDRARESAAAELGISVSTLDKVVRERQREIIDAKYQEQAVEPWKDPVDGVELLNSLSASCKRFIVLPEHADVALSLWVMFTYLMDVVNVAPIMAPTSPEKRCGKTTVLVWLLKLTYKALPASNISPTAVFRIIEKRRPTLIVDEIETFLKDNEELRGVLNSGHTRDMAFVIRNVEIAGKIEPQSFSTWSAKAVALIGELPGTLHDRSIGIPMHRKMPGVQLEKMRHAPAEHFAELASKCLRLANDCRERVKLVRPTIPNDLNDRAADNWEPLLQIAEIVGGAWPEKARKAATALSGSDNQVEGTSIELLGDVRKALADRPQDRIPSADLIKALCADEDRPWNTYNKGKPISPSQLAKKLKPFKMRPTSVRVAAGGTPKGYKVEDFEDAFKRYLSPLDEKPQQRNNVTDLRTYTATDEAQQGETQPPQGQDQEICGGVSATSHGLGENEAAV